MTDILSDNSEKIKKLNRHKTRWAVLGLIFILYLAFIIATWIENVHINPAFWIISGIIIVIITVIWWIWTFSLVNDILKNRIKEVAILNNIVVDLKSVKSEIESLKNM
jgi:uncharacterized protein YacL